VLGVLGIPRDDNNGDGGNTGRNLMGIISALERAATWEIFTFDSALLNSFENDTLVNMIAFEAGSGKRPLSA
jgi:hypothetical protein